MDEITELADRLRAKQRRGEELGLEFEIDFASLTPTERRSHLSSSTPGIASWFSSAKVGEAGRAA